MNSASALEAALRDAGLDWIVPDWPAADGVHAFVTTRNAAAAAFDLAPRAGDLLTRPRPDQEAWLARFLPAPARWLHQVHGRQVVEWHMERAETAAPLADAAITLSPNVVCAVRVADCLPVLFADRDGRAVGVAHAGWRGLAGGVLEATVGAFAERGIEARGLIAYLGPAIGPQAFEVGDDVREAFLAAGDDQEAFIAHGEGKWHADLFALARARLRAAAVERVHGGGDCTFSDRARFHSWRRDRSSARMAAYIWRE